MKTTHLSQSGFALLLTMIVISIVLAIGLSLLDITLKQFLLSGTVRDSEVAFHAAYAGTECAQYWRFQNFSSFSPPDFPECLGHSVTAQVQSSGNPNVSYSSYEITWGSTNDLCTEIDMFIFDATTADVTHSIPNYGSQTCPSGDICTVVLSRGYNRACSDITSVRTVQREVVLEF